MCTEWARKILREEKVCVASSSHAGWDKQTPTSTGSPRAQSRRPLTSQMGQQSCPERYNNVQVARVASRKARTGARPPDSITPHPPRHLCIPLSAQVWALKKTATSRVFSQTKDFWKPCFPFWHFVLLKSLLPKLHKRTNGRCV